MAFIHSVSKKRELKVNGQIISCPLHLQRMPSEITGAIQLPKGEQHLGKLHRDTVSHVFSGQTEVLYVDGVK